ncbi:MAG: fluoride efflux transporter CrcB [Bacillus subtilis]|nr:fluoride efflux transporter CrcB [Bacillus subtilis]
MTIEIIYFLGDVEFMLSFLAIFIGGGIGAILRYFVSVLSNKYIGIDFPYGTLIVNIVGCFFLGLVIALSLSKIANINQNLLLFLTTGIAGGFTTFSAFSYESLTLLEKGEFLKKLCLYLLKP